MPQPKVTHKHWESLDLKAKYNNGKIESRPSYQRYIVWKRPQKIMFIDSLIRGYDVPKIYLRKTATKYEVVDGQQRLDALFTYMGGKFVLFKNTKNVDGLEIAGLKYVDLPLDISEKIDTFTFDIMVLENYSDEEIAEYFIRLQNGSSLKGAERRRGIVSNMRDMAFELSKHNFFDICNFNNRRCQYEDFIAKFFHLIKHNFMSNPTADKMDKDWWKNLNIDYSKDAVVKKIRSVFNFIYDSLGEYYNSSFGTYLAITLCIVVYDLLENTNINLYKKQFSDCIDSFLLDLEKAEKSISNGEECSPNWSQYVSLKRSDSIKALQNRSDVLVNHIREKLNDLIDKYPSRCFSSIQKARIYKKHKGVCAKCGYKGNSVRDFEADHKIPYIRGGQTTVENGQLLCPRCNRVKSDNIEIILRKYS